MPAPASISPAEPRRRSFPWVHGVLFLATVFTTTLAGSLYWQDSPSSGLSLLRDGWPYALCLLLILGSHEFGHYFACRRYGIPATLPFFLPAPPPLFLGTFGAVIRIRGVIPDRKALFDVAAAGPIAGFAVALPILIAGIVRAAPVASAVASEGVSFGSPLASLVFEKWIHGGADLRVNPYLGAGWVGMLVTSLNLFPVGQLDGGHATYALSRRLHRWLSYATIGGLLVIVSYQFHSPTAVPVHLLWLGVAMVMRDRHPRLLDESGDVGTARRCIAVVLLLIFSATFIPVPIRIV